MQILERWKNAELFAVGFNIIQRFLNESKFHAELQDIELWNVIVVAFVGGQAYRYSVPIFISFHVSNSC
jgi:hypothetical protein